MVEKASVCLPFCVVWVSFSFEENQDFASEILKKTYNYVIL